MKKINSEEWEDIEERYRYSLKGRDRWFKLKEKYQIDKEWYLILMPTCNKKLNHTAFLYLNEFRNKKYIKKILVVISDHGKDNSISFNKWKDVYIENVDEQVMTELVLYYRLQQFFRNIIVISAEEPFGTGGIVGKCSITLDDYVRDALYV